MNILPLKLLLSFHILKATNSCLYIDPDQAPIRVEKEVQGNCSGANQIHIGIRSHATAKTGRPASEMRSRVSKYCKASVEPELISVKPSAERNARAVSSVEPRGTSRFAICPALAGVPPLVSLYARKKQTVSKKKQHTNHGAEITMCGHEGILIGVFLCLFPV